MHSDACRSLMPYQITEIQREAERYRREATVQQSIKNELKLCTYRRSNSNKYPPSVRPWPRYRGMPRPRYGFTDYGFSQDTDSPIGESVSWLKP